MINSWVRKGTFLGRRFRKGRILREGEGGQGKGGERGRDSQRLVNVTINYSDEGARKPGTAFKVVLVKNLLVS